MTVKKPPSFYFYGIPPAELGEKYVTATLAGRSDIVASIDLFVFESGQFGEEEIGEFIAVTDEAENVIFGSGEDDIAFDDEDLAVAMIENGINPMVRNLAPFGGPQFGGAK